MLALRTEVRNNKGVRRLGIRADVLKVLRKWKDTVVVPRDVLDSLSKAEALCIQKIVLLVDLPSVTLHSRIKSFEDRKERNRTPE